MAKPSLAYFVVICLTAVPASKSILHFIDQHPFSEKKSTSLWTALNIWVHAPLDGVPLFWGPAPTPSCTVPILARAGAGELFQFIRMRWPKAGHSNHRLRTFGNDFTATLWADQLPLQETRGQLRGHGLQVSRWVRGSWPSDGLLTVPLRMHFCSPWHLVPAGGPRPPASSFLLQPAPENTGSCSPPSLNPFLSFLLGNHFSCQTDFNSHVVLKPEHSCNQSETGSGDVQGW